jgi:acetolactate synthase-1/2/3 large subunit
VEKLETCLPLLPTRKTHNEMILPDFKGDVGNVIDARGRELV